MFEVEIENSVAVLRMAHGKVNAMSLEFVQQFNAQLNNLSSNEAVGFVVVAGNSRVFSAGVDLKRLVSEGSDYLEQFLPELSKMFLNVFSFQKPLVAAITGHAVAGGCVLACAADFRLISEEASIGVPELRVGVPFPSAGMEIMRWAAEGHAFRKIINTGATYIGEQAVEVGLADKAVSQEQVIEEAVQALDPFRVVPTEVFQLTKKQMRLPAMDRIARSETSFGAEIIRLWHDEKTRRAVADYVAERLN